MRGCAGGRRTVSGVTDTECDLGHQSLTVRSVTDRTVRKNVRVVRIRTRDEILRAAARQFPARLQGHVAAGHRRPRSAAPRPRCCTTSTARTRSCSPWSRPRRRRWPTSSPGSPGSTPRPPRRPRSRASSTSCCATGGEIALIYDATAAAVCSSPAFARRARPDRRAARPRSPGGPATRPTRIAAKVSCSPASPPWSIDRPATTRCDLRAALIAVGRAAPSYPNREKD